MRETLMPRPVKSGIRRSISVVLPAPEYPANPKTLIPSSVAARSSARGRRATRGDVALERHHVDGHPDVALDALLEARIAHRRLRLETGRLADRIGELRRQRRLQADHRHALLAMGLRDEQAVGGMGVHQHVVALVHLAD